MEVDLSIDKVGEWDPFAYDFDLHRRMQRAGWQIAGRGGFGELGRDISVIITRQEDAASIDPGEAISRLWPDNEGELPGGYMVNIDETSGLLRIAYDGPEESQSYRLFLKSVIGVGKRINDESETSEGNIQS